MGGDKRLMDTFRELLPNLHLSLESPGRHSKRARIRIHLSKREESEYFKEITKPYLLPCMFFKTPDGHKGVIGRDTLLEYFSNDFKHSGF